MEERDAFAGTPLGTAPHAEWNLASRWNDYYTQLFSEPIRYEHIVHRGTHLLERMLREAGTLPLAGSPGMFLDAGCGISLIPHLVAYWGFQVTAIDPSDVAIDHVRDRAHDEATLARCVQILVPCPDMPDALMEVDDPGQRLQHLRSLHVPGGSVRYRQCDWFSSELEAACFNVIYCRNALRGSLKPYWRRSLIRFRELLSPGGVLLLENVNAFGIKDEVSVLLSETGFRRLTKDQERETTERYVMTSWPTG